MDNSLLQKVDQAAQLKKVPRSQFICNTLEDALRQLTIQELEQKQAEGYHCHPVLPGEFDL